MSHKGREMQEIKSRGRMKSRPDGISGLRVIRKSRIDLEKLQIGDCPYYRPYYHLSTGEQVRKKIDEL